MVIRVYKTAEILKVRKTANGTDLIINVPDRSLADSIYDKLIRHTECRFDDGRSISIEQRKKAYATIRDISIWTGYLPEEQKEWLKYLYIIRTGRPYLSLGNCSMDEAREFISTILEYALEEGIPLSEPGVQRSEDIGRYLYACIKNKKCAICGKPGEIHHVDAIGMGNDRRKLDDRDHRKICLCREHHTISHQKGRLAFERMYHVYGIKYDDPVRKKLTEDFENLEENYESVDSNGTSDG